MDQDTELREMFAIAHPNVYASVSDNNDVDLDGILGVELPKKKKKNMKPRGRPFTSEGNNPQKSRWRCLECDMESNLTGILRHQRISGHKGKQQVFATLESLGVV